MGGRAEYLGKVRDDQLGHVFAHDIRATGVTYEVPLAAAGPATGCCLILVTPDAQRTMNTYLGASVHLGPDDVDEHRIAGFGVVSRGVPVRSSGGSGGVPGRRPVRARGRPGGLGDAVGRILCGASSRRAPGSRREPRRPVVRQRGGDPGPVWHR
ncbi:MAG: PfkB family carbohydrate kinase [Microthrixaceae bacterium]